MPSTNPGSFDSKRFLPWAIAGFLLLAVAIVYGQTLWFGFLDYDDNIFVTASPPVQAGLTAKSIAWAFTNGPLGEWYPLAMLSHMLDCQLFGLQAWGHHLTNILLHAATAIGLFFVLRAMTLQRAVPGTDRRLVVAQASGGRVAPAGPSARTLFPSALVATLFAVHPQHVESVAWIAERRDVLSGLFFVLTLAAYWGYVRGSQTDRGSRRGKQKSSQSAPVRSLGRYLLVALMLALGLMAKSMLVTVPPLLLLLDYWPLGRFGQAADLPTRVPALPKQSFWSLVVEKLPLLAIALADSAISYHTHATRQKFGHVLHRLAGALVSLVEYLVQFFYPAKLAVFYPPPAAGYSPGQVCGALSVLLAITAAAFWFRRQMPYFVVGWCWFVGMMIPVLGLVPIAEHARADRYMYLPGIGLLIALVWMATRAAERAPKTRWALVGGSAVATIALAAVAAVQTTYWRDDLTLWRHAASVTEDNSEVQVGLGDGLRHAHKLEEAVDHYRQAAALDPQNTTVANNLGGTLFELERLDEAAAAYRVALENDPDNVLAHVSLSTVLGRLGQSADAELHLRRAIELDPTASIPHIYLALLYFKAGRPDLALQERQQAAIHDPNNARNRAELAKLRAQLGDLDGAIADFQAVLKLEPRSLPAHISLGQLLAARGKTDEAIVQFQQALAIDPNQSAVRDSLEKLRRGRAAPRP